MNITINIVEASTELAHEEVLKEFNNQAPLIYKSVSGTITEYTDEAQRIFDEKYDFFYDKLLTLKY